MPVSYANWMEQTLDFSKTLKDISIPGSHDAGMYISINCSVGAGSCNTRTQNQTMLGQLPFFYPGSEVILSDFDRRRRKKPTVRTDSLKGRNRDERTAATRS